VALGAAINPEEVEHRVENDGTSWPEISHLVAAILWHHCRNCGAHDCYFKDDHLRGGCGAGRHRLFFCR
jgi:hypothetical protein